MVCSFRDWQSEGSLEGPHIPQMQVKGHGQGFLNLEESSSGSFKEEW